MPPADPRSRETATLRLEKARRFLSAAIRLVEDGYWDGATSDAVLAGIAAVDAYLLQVHGVAHHGRSHAELLRVLRKRGGRSLEVQTKALGRLLSVKAVAQYGEKLSTEREARDAVVRAERLVGWAEKALKGA